LRASLGAAARDFVAAEHSLERSATGYLDTLSELLGQPLTLSPAPDNVPTPVAAPAGLPGRNKRTPFRTPHSALRIRNRLAPAAVPSPDACPDDPLLDGVAEALDDLRLAGHEPLVRSVARDLVTLGLRAEDGVVAAGKEGRWRARLRLAGRR
jgi:hypothetical protein